MYEKICPTCGDKMSYKNKDSLNESIRFNRSCRKCGWKRSSEKQRVIRYCVICGDEIPKGKVGDTCCDKHRVELIKRTKQEKYGDPNFNDRDKAKKTTLEKYGVENVSQMDFVKDLVTSKGRYYSTVDMSGENNPMFGKHQTDETKQKQRARRIESLLTRNNIYPGYNPKSIPIIESKAKELGITDLQHAENGGEFHIEELGYFVDGYSKEKNIVIEFDEKHHKYQKNKDLKRQKEIEEFLGCKFIRIKYEPME